MSLSESTVVQLAIAVLTLIGTIVGSLIAYRAKVHASATNDAVNHRVPGEDKLIDIVVKNAHAIGAVKADTEELVDWKKSYDGGPLDDGEKVVKFVSSVDLRLKEIEKKMEKAKCMKLLEDK